MRLSPSVWAAPGKLSKLAREARLGKDTVIYTDYGSEEGRQRPKVAGQLSKLANILESREVMMTRRIVPGGHSLRGMLGAPAALSDSGADVRTGVAEGG